MRGVTQCVPSTAAITTRNKAVSVALVKLTRWELGNVALWAYDLLRVYFSLFHSIRLGTQLEEPLFEVFLPFLRITF